MKSTAMLTIALFLAVAPSPDAEILSEITGGFLKANQNLELSESDFMPATQSMYFKQSVSSDSLTESSVKHDS